MGAAWHLPVGAVGSLRFEFYRGISPDSFAKRHKRVVWMCFRVLSRSNGANKIGFLVEMLAQSDVEMGSSFAG